MQHRHGRFRSWWWREKDQPVRFASQPKSQVVTSGDGEWEGSGSNAGDEYVGLGAAPDENKPNRKPTTCASTKLLPAGWETRHMPSVRSSPSDGVSGVRVKLFTSRFCQTSLQQGIYDKQQDIDEKNRLLIAN